MQRARKQVEGSRPRREEPGSSYNIWYHKNSFTPEDLQTPIIKAARKCNLQRDQGITKAKPDSYLCLHFIRGNCCMGYECKYFHHIPSQEEISHLPIVKDVFGRDRHGTDKDDMNGVGNFNKENKTLFVGRLPAKADDMYNLLYKNFSEWGEIEDITIPSVDKSIAFVRYLYRSSAEIAKVAMDCQSLGFGDVLMIRWAYADPNPKKKKEAEAVFAEASKSKLENKATEIIDNFQTDVQNTLKNDFQVFQKPVFPTESIDIKNSIEKISNDYEKNLGEYYSNLGLIGENDNTINNSEEPSIEQTKHTNDNSSSLQHPPGIDTFKKVKRKCADIEQKEKRDIE